MIAEYVLRDCGFTVFAEDGYEADNLGKPTQIKTDLPDNNRLDSGTDVTNDTLLRLSQSIPESEKASLSATGDPNELVKGYLSQYLNYATGENTGSTGDSRYNQEEPEPKE